MGRSFRRVNVGIWGAHLSVHHEPHAISGALIRGEFPRVHVFALSRIPEQFRVKNDVLGIA